MTHVRDDQLPEGAGTAKDAVTPKLASSTIVMRRHPFEVLMLRRTPESTFVPDAWVFPGGAVDTTDREVAAALGAEGELGVMRVCAARELLEETGLWVGDDPPSDLDEARQRLLDDPSVFARLAKSATPNLEALVWTSRWITPAGVPKRYDTWFFLLQADENTEGSPERREGMELRWVRPREALELHRRGEFAMVFPTIKNLEAIAGFEASESLLRVRRGATVQPVEPRLVLDGGKKRIVLPGEE